MALVTLPRCLRKAYDGGYAIGAFNVNNMEIIQGITEAAIEKRAPLILQVSKGARAYAKHVYLMKLIEAAIEDAEQTAGFDLPDLRAPRPRRYLRTVQELHRRRLHLRHDRRFLQVL